MKRFVIVLGLVALTAMSAATGAERTLTLEQVTILQDGRGQARVVFRMPEIAPGERIVVSRAQFSVPLSGAAAERSIRLRVYPITRAWGAGATWTTPWTRPGGDFDEDVYLPVDVDLRRGHAVFDLTGLVKEAVEEGRPTYGYLLTRDPDDGLGIPVDDASRLQGLTNARIAVSYLQVGPPPRQRS